MSLDHVRVDTAFAPIRPFSGLLDITEGAFVQAGNSLEDSLTQLQSLRTAFSALELTLGAEASLALKGQVADVTRRSADLRSGFDQFGATTRSLREIMAQIRSEVRSLNTVVSLFANISINARIQGNSLMPPRPQINSFIARLGSLSAEADDILRAVNEAMAAALDAVLEIEAAQSALSDELQQNTLPEIESFTSIARGISDDQAALHDASVQIASKMQAVSSDVGTLVMSLQIGDTLRQRLEQVHASLALATHGPNEKALSLHMAPVLAEGAIADAMPYIDDAMAALQAVADRGAEINRAATSSAFGTGALRRARSGQDAVERLEASLHTNRALFAAMQVSAQTARDQIESILGYNPALQRIAQHLRMAGINAVIACARLGEEGRALRELAQWLRAMTDESDSTMERLQIVLARSRDAIFSVSQDLIVRSDENLTEFVAASTRLGGAIGHTNAVLADTSGRFDAVAADLATRLASANGALRLVRSRMIDAGPTIAVLRLLASVHPKPGVESADAQDYLSTLRRCYTMASERTLHDRLVASFATDAPEGVSIETLDNAKSEPAPATSAAVDDLDDILF